jgi:hypothetical protein
MKIEYNFRLAPEAVWLIVNTVLGAVLIEVMGYVTGLTTLPAWDDFRTWLVALGLSAVRTLLGAFLAAVTGGGFQTPGEPGPAPTPPPAE